MNKYIKSILFFLFLSLPSFLSKGQQSTCFNIDIAEKFKRYCKTIPREDVYLHTDRDEYIAGEDVWLNAYLFDRMGSKLSEGSDVIYTELLNSENQPVVQKKIGIEKGAGPGLFVLPDTLSTGTYVFRAYTAWMKNFLPANCFMKKIKVYNSLNSKRVSGIAGTGTINDKKTIVQDSDLLSQRGFILKINSIRSDTLEVLISANESFRQLNGNLLYIFIQTHGVINFNEPLRLKGSTTRINLPKSILIPGISQLVAFSSRGKFLTEAYFYTPSGEKNQLSLTSREIFKKRNKVQVEIDPADIPGTKTGEMHLSLSAASGPVNDQEADMADYVVFGTEFGTLPDAIRGKKLNLVPLEAINDFLASAKSNWIDWNAILSGNYPDLKYRIEKDNHSLSGLLLRSGTLEPDSSRYVFLSSPGKAAYFQYAKTDYAGRFTFTIPSTLSEKEIIVQPADAQRGYIIKIESSFPGIYFPVSKIAYPLPKIVPPYVSQWSANYQISKIYNTSSTGNAIKVDKHLVEPLRFYGKPDIKLILADYIKLPVMQEVFFELLPGVIMKSRKSTWEITVTDPVERVAYNTPPLLLVDGVVVQDASVIANLDPEQVEKIDVVMDKYIVGVYLMSGIVNVITKKADLSTVVLPDYAVRLFFRKADPVFSFSSPDYSSEVIKNNHVPDFRNTLYWNPSLKQDNDGKFRIEFYSSDMESDYTINIQGVNGDGKPVSLRKVISVR
jgi:hypothetical protein